MGSELWVGCCVELWVSFAYRPACVSVSRCMSFLEGVLRCRVLGVVLCVSLLAGCASSAPQPGTDVKPSLGKTWTVIPVLTPVPEEAKDGVTLYQDVLQSVTMRYLDALGQPARVYRAASSNTAPMAMDSLFLPAPAEDEPRPLRKDRIQAIQESTGSRYLLLLKSARWERSIFDSISFSPSVGFEVSAAGPGLFIGLFKVGPTRIFTASMALVDARTSEIIWNQTQGLQATDLSDTATADALINAYTRSMALQLVTGAEVSSMSFGVEADGGVIVYRHDAPTVRGSSVSVDGFDVVVGDEDGATRRYPIQSVSSIKSTSQNRRIFPAGGS